MDPVLLALAPIALLAYTTEALTGFGATLVAVTLGAHFYPIDRLVPVLVGLNVCVTGYIALRHRAHVATGLLFRRILPFMILGVVIGLALYPLVQGADLKRPLGAFVMVFAGRELALLAAKRQRTGRPLTPRRTAAWQVAAGIVQAFYATGGPLLVYSLSRLDLSKAVFRATLCTVWVTLNGFLVVAFALNGRINPASLELTAWLLPVVPLGILIGERLHGWVDERLFKLCIYGLLFISGLTLVL